MSVKLMLQSISYYLPCTSIYWWREEGHWAVKFALRMATAAVIVGEEVIGLY